MRHLETSSIGDRRTGHAPCDTGLMTDREQVERERESERVLTTKEREQRDHDMRAKERDEYNLPFTD